MAFINFTGLVRMIDEHTMRSSKRVNIRIDDAVHTTLAAQQAAASAALIDWVEKLDAIIDAVIFVVEIAMPLLPTGLKSSAGDQGVAEGAQLQLATVHPDGAKSRPYFLPAAAATIFQSNFRDVDIGDLDLIAWVESFSGTGFEITISDLEEVTAVEGGKYATVARKFS